MVLHSRGCGRVARRRFTRIGPPGRAFGSREAPFFVSGVPVELTLRKPHFLSPNLLFLLPVLPADPMRVPGRAFLFPVFPSSSRGPRLSILDFHLIPRSPAGAWKSFPLLVFSLRRRGFLLEDRKNYGFGTSCVPCIKALRLVLWQELRCMTLQRRRVCLPRRSPSPSGIPTK